MHPILFSVGNFHFPTSSLILFVAFISSLFFFWKKARIEIIEEEKIFDLVFAVIFFSLVAGRLVYVFEHPFDFHFLLDRVIHVYKFPGFNLWGMCFGGLLGVFIYLRRFAKNQRQYLLDIFSLSFSLFLSFAFVAFFFDGVYVGQISKFFGLTFVGFAGPRLPIQIVASLLFFLYFMFLKNIHLGRNKGLLFWLFNAYFFSIFLALEFLRGDRIYFEGIVINKFTFFLVAFFSIVIFLTKYKNVLLGLIKKIKLIKLNSKL